MRVEVARTALAELVVGGSLIVAEAVARGQVLGTLWPGGSLERGRDGGGFRRL